MEVDGNWSNPRSQVKRLHRRLVLWRYDVGDFLTRQSALSDADARRREFFISKKYFLISKKVRNFLESGARLDRPQYASRQLYQIMRDCWKAEPSERPKFRDLADDLEKELETLDRERQLDMNGDDSE